jgi:hypothetical protein
VRWAPNQVKPPSVLTQSNLHPSAHQVLICVVWVRYTAITAETITLIDTTLSAHDPSHPTPHTATSTLAEKVESACLSLETLIAEFEIERHMKAANTPDPIRCLLADHLMNIYAVIIGMKRLANPPDSPVDATTLRAARKVVSTLLDFETDPMLPRPDEMFVQYVSLLLLLLLLLLLSPSPLCNPPN